MKVPGLYLLVIFHVGLSDHVYFHKQQLLSSKALIRRSLKDRKCADVTGWDRAPGCSFHLASKRQGYTLGARGKLLPTAVLWLLSVSSLGCWRIRSSINQCDRPPLDSLVERSRVPLYCYSTVCQIWKPMLDCSTTMDYWVLEFKNVKKGSFCMVEFWHSFHSVMNHLLQQVQDLTLPRLAERVGGDNWLCVKIPHRADILLMNQ